MANYSFKFCVVTLLGSVGGGIIIYLFVSFFLLLLVLCGFFVCLFGYFYTNIFNARLSTAIDLEHNRVITCVSGHTHTHTHTHTHF